MNPWIVKVTILLATIALIAIRAPFGQRSVAIPVVANRKGTLEVLLLTLAWLSFLLTLLWIILGFPEFADYPLHVVPYAIGVVFLLLGLWLFYRSHADLGANWSITLQVRDKHELITNGLYALIRHPMYSALLVYSLGQALVLPNWIAGPSYGIAMLFLIVFRVGPEERMMLDTFGVRYAEYCSKTKRVIPGVW